MDRIEIDIMTPRALTVELGAAKLIAGPQGPRGERGEDGVSPSARVDQTAEGAVVTVKDASGTTTALLAAVEPSTTTPKMNGTASVGAEAKYARGDHVHPKDTSKANLASPTFTGTPRAPTAAAGTNTTQIATTAFVTAAVAAEAAAIMPLSFAIGRTSANVTVIRSGGVIPVLTDDMSAYQSMRALDFAIAGGVSLSSLAQTVAALQIVHRTDGTGHYFDLYHNGAFNACLGVSAGGISYYDASWNPVWYGKPTA